MWASLDRPRLWRATALLSALLLCGLVVACAQGSLTIINRRPTANGVGNTTHSWERWCTRGVPRQDRKRLAFCARIEGRVITSTHGPGPREAHVALLSDFHIVLVLLPAGAGRPKMGARVIAIGPLFRSRDGQPEVQAFRYEAT